MVIYTDAERREQGFLQFDRADFDLTDKKDFEIVIGFDEKAQTVELGSIITEEHGDCGGIIGEKKVSTGNRTITYRGYTWLGILEKRIVEPRSGDDYYIINGEISVEVNSLLDYTGFEELFVFDDLSDRTVKPSLDFVKIQLPRYCTVLEALKKIAETTGTYLKLRYKRNDDGKATVGIGFDYSYFYDRRFKVIANFTTMDKTNGVNHLICLGKGELKDRAVAHFYIGRKGNVTEKQELFGLDEVAEIYEDTSSDLEELTKRGLEKIVELAKKTKAIVDIDDNGELTSIMQEPVVGDTIENSTDGTRIDITNRIVSYDNDNRKIQYKSETEGGE